MKQWTNNKKPPMGGSEILLNGLHKHSKVDEYKNINVLLSTPNVNNIKYSKHNILWQHLSYSDPSLATLNDPKFMRSIGSFVYVSHWQYEKFRYLFKVPTENSYVIKNAIEPIEFIKKEKSEKIKLIYISAPYRGLDILLDSLDILNRDDIEVDVYSSTLLYGTDYAEYHKGMWDEIIEKAKTAKNVNYVEYAENKEIHKALQQAHIFAYPSVFEETCCLAMVEAGAAGCKLVTTDLGALYETGAEFASMIPIQADRDILIQNYAKILDYEIDTYWSKSNQALLKKQSDYYNAFYSWEKRSTEWNNLFDQISSS